MTPAVNTLVARALLALTPVAAAIATRAMAARIRAFPAEQARLRALYGIDATTPIRGYDDDTRARIRASAAHDPRVRLATTSGSTGAPKELAYPPERVQSYRRDSISIGIRAFAHFRARTPGLFVLASLQKDSSFASLVLHERGRAGRAPPYVPSLVEPSRYLAHPALAPLIAEHGVTATRVWLLCVANPALLYATNPSTIAAFFTEVHDRWPDATALVRAHVARDPSVTPALDAVAARVALGDHRARLRAIADAGAPLAATTWLPELRAWVAWDGGYVTAFLPEVHKHLPPDRVPQLGMYSMSTETIETLTWFEGANVHFLPLAPRVLYEMLPDGAPDDPALLVAPTQMRAGDVASMVVSDPWGLVRYQTDDLFECRAIVRGLPDLRFLRRRGLAYSFTGEKLTGEQLSLAYTELRAQFPALSTGVELALFPDHAASDAVPSYALAIAHTGERAPAVEHASVARALDDALGRGNAEYAAKRASARLGPIHAHAVSWTALAAALDTRTVSDEARHNRAWESQFKLQPLMRARWDALAPRLPPSR